MAFLSACPRARALLHGCDYLAICIELLSGPAVSGAMIGGEGFFALWASVLVGDGGISLRTRIGGRVPLILAATALALPALILMPLARFLPLSRPCG
jgi:hypothetical protein